MISKELLSEVLDKEILEMVDFCPKNQICWKYNNVTKIGNISAVAKDGGYGSINIYELAMKCRYALKKIIGKITYRTRGNL